jgi:hypothetical protein
MEWIISNSGKNARKHNARLASKLLSRFARLKRYSSSPPNFFSLCW